MSENVQTYSGIDTVCYRPIVGGGLSPSLAEGVCGLRWLKIFKIFDPIVRETSDESRSRILPIVRELQTNSCDPKSPPYT